HACDGLTEEDRACLRRLSHPRNPPLAPWLLLKPEKLLSPPKGVEIGALRHRFRKLPTFATGNEADTSVISHLLSLSKGRGASGGSPKANSSCRRHDERPANAGELPGSRRRRWRQPYLPPVRGRKRFRHLSWSEAEAKCLKAQEGG